MAATTTIKIGTNIKVSSTSGSVVTTISDNNNISTGSTDYLFVGTDMLITSTAYKAIQLAPLTSFSYVYLYNNDTGSVGIAIGIPVLTTTSSFAYLYPEESLVMPVSKSVLLYAKSFGGNATMSIKGIGI